MKLRFLFSSFCAGLAVAACALPAPAQNDPIGNRTAPGFEVLIVETGQHLTLKTDPVLPTGDGDYANHWIALWGTISRDGKQYTAPAEPPPFGLDTISYNCAGGGPDVQLEVLVRSTRRMEATAIPLDSEKFAPRGAKGYRVPVWSDTGSVRVWVATGSGKSVKTGAKRSPVNAPPAPNIARKEGQWYTVSSGWQSQKTGESGWRTSHLKGTATSQLLARIQEKYGTRPDPAIDMDYSHRSFAFQRVACDDHFVVRGGKMRYVYTVTRAQHGEGMVFTPVWFHFISGWPPPDQVLWLSASRFPIL